MSLGRGRVWLGLVWLLWGLVGALSAQSTWTDRTAGAGIGGILHDVAFGNGAFVAVGTNTSAALVYSSPDGVVWSDRTAALGRGGILNGVTFANGRFVAVGTNTAAGLFASSTDGAVWTDHAPSPGIGGVFNAVAYGNGVWVAVGQTGSLAAIATSPDGTTWTARTTTAGVGGDLKGITFANGKFVAVGTNGSLVVLATSTNGQSWSVHTSTNGIGGVANDVTFDGAQFIATGDGTPGFGSTTALILTSVDGISWTNRTAGAGLGGIGHGIASGGGTTVVVGRTSAAGLLATSIDPVTWANLSSVVAAPGDLNAVVRGDHAWVAVGTNTASGVVVTSPTGAGGSGSGAVFVDDALAVPNTGGSFTVAVTAGAGVSWTATTASDWISLGSPTGTGDGSFSAFVQFNVSAETRAGSILVGADTLPVNQVGTPLQVPRPTASFDTNTGAIELRWNFISSTEGYEIERRIGPNGAFVPWMTLNDRAVTTVSDPDPVGAREYAYRIRSIAGSQASAWSETVVVSTPPDIPGGLTATSRNASQIELTWNDVSGETGYLLYRANGDETFFRIVARLDPDETTFIDSGLDPSTPYQYQIEAESSRSFGRRSGAVTATTETQTRSIVWDRAESVGARDYYGIAAGAGVAVAVGSQGRTTISSDGWSWTEVTPTTRRTLRAVDFGGGHFVAVGDRGTILHSSDGSVWTAASSMVSEDLSGVAYFAGTWYAVGLEGALLTSTDGLNWSSGPRPAQAGFVDIFAGDRLVATEETGRVVMSEDGTSWVASRAEVPPETTEPFFWTRTAGAFGGGAYALVGPNSYHSSSADALSWVEHAGGSFNYYEAVAYGADRFVAVGLNGRTGSSQTGAGYVSGLDADESLFAITHAFGHFIAAGARGLIVASPDGFTWTKQQDPEGTAATLTTVAAGGGRLVAFGSLDFGAVSVRNAGDGNGWIEADFSVPGLQFDPQVWDATYVNGQFIAVGSEGLIATSPGGETWTVQRTAAQDAFGDSLRSVAGDNSQLLVGGGVDGLLRSTDAAGTWSPVPDLPNSFTPWNLAYGARWVGQFGGAGTLRLHSSVDGLVWNTAIVVGQGGNVSTLVAGTLQGEPLHLGVGTDFSGASPEALVSWDGRNWRAREALGVDGPVDALAYGANLFVAVGRGGAYVWASLDGVTWEPAPAGFLPEVVDLQGGFRDIVYADGQFYAVGFGGLIAELNISASDFALAIPTVTTTLSPTTLRLSWPGSAAYTYQVLERSELDSGSWTPVGAVIAGADGTLSVDITLSPASGRRFWAVQPLP